MKISKVAVAAMFYSSLFAGDMYWANGVNTSGGWSVYLQHPNQCWGAVAGNTLGWWQKNVTGSINFGENTPQGNVAITDYFYKKYPYIQGGLQPYRGMIYFFKDFAPNVKIYETKGEPTYLEKKYGPTKISGAPFWTERYDSNADKITNSLIENFKTGKVVAALTDDTHTVTLWGIEVDEKTQRITGGYVSDSVKDEAGTLSLRKVTGNYVPGRNGEVFRFLYSYYVSNTNKYITDLYDIYSITYLSIDEARNNGTYVDTSDRKDCLASVLPGYEGVCGVAKNENVTPSENNQNQGENSENSKPTPPENNQSGNENVTPPNNQNQGENTNPTPPENGNQNQGENTQNPKPTPPENSSNNQENSNENQGGITPPNNQNQGENSKPTPPENSNKPPKELPTDAGSKKEITSESTANDSTTNAVKNAANAHSELSVNVKNFGDASVYTISKNGRDIGIYSPAENKIEVINAGLVNYDIKEQPNGKITITKASNEAAVKEANDMASLNLDVGYVEVNNLNKRMGELRGINANAGVWGRVLGGKGSGNGYENKFTHIQVGADKQSDLAGTQIFSGFTLTHTANDVKANGGDTSGDIKSTGGGIYAATLFDSGFYIDAIAKYVRNNHKFDYNFKNMNLNFPNSKYNTHTIYLGGEIGYRFDLGVAYFEPQAEFIYLKNSGAKLSHNGYDLEIKDSNALIGRVGFNAGREINLGELSTYVLGGLSYQWDIDKNSEIIVDGESAKYNKKDSRMLMNLGVNIKASENLRFGIDLERSAFGDYDTDLAINANVRYSF
ncbi:autotransporter outer membrane beta-barrel domain-containing protein [Campylobacter gastrosuis]|uniref:Autotransporter outer membrane beta-barrel domain-containing protein n=1 Tax=Campylobacter gastrosuis TaxID=2974576 RepID=A0ABT7HMU3_9BACT|nr:autotransporter outer membrane beta-barrel domain-containing protein [Campylobacter gastrosuis]MDL0087933.1 autotransporter outer membrane beta-barrel domain-containing protein [Campylobacter gastrosuis]